MIPSSPRLDTRTVRPRGLPAICVLLAVAFALVVPAVAGPLTGRVTNATSGDPLTGAQISVPALGITVHADANGEYVIRDLPAGQHTIIARYSGLDSLERTVEIGVGGQASFDFEMNSRIYELEEFRVTGEREGNAASIMRQRSAANVTNVVAMDAFGNLPNMSIGELAARLPGLAGGVDDGGEITTVIIRGTPADLNRVTIDGMLVTGAAGLNRNFQVNSLNGAMFDEMEVIKGHRPDRSADSLGGTVNLKSKSPLSIKGRHQTNYNLGFRWAPPFTEQIPERRNHPIHPQINFTHQQVFDVLGGKRNLGIAFSAFYSENLVVYDNTVLGYQATTDSPAFNYQFNARQGMNNRKQRAFNLRADYQLSPETVVSLKLLYNDTDNPFNKQYVTNAVAPQTIATLGPDGQPTGNGGILPGFTDTMTQVRGVSNSQQTLNSITTSTRNERHGIDLGVEHKFGRLAIEYRGTHHWTDGIEGGGSAARMPIRANGIGWRVDRSQSDHRPVYTQTEGPSIADFDSYTVFSPLMKDAGSSYSEITTFVANARYELPTRIPFALKAGAEWRKQANETNTRDRQWTFVGDRSLFPVDPTFELSETVKAGRLLPYFDATANFNNDGTLVNPSLWREDLYYRESQFYTGTSSVEETVGAAFAMFEGRWNRLQFLGGVRAERTEVNGHGWVRGPTLSTTAQRAADPVGAAASDYAENRREISGDYTDVFPSLHTAYDITENLKARLSWSTSFGRPSFGRLVPAETPNLTQEWITVNNPALKPQYSKNWDAALEYYFEPVGMLSVGWFQKDITDYIVGGIEVGTVGTGPDNGYNGDYEGFTIRTSGNAGGAMIRGWEFNYQQQFTFLPGPLKGLAASLNYTKLETEGDYGGTSIVGTSEVANFVPRTWNASLSYRYKKFNGRVLTSYTSRYLNSLNTNPALSEYRYARTTVNLSLGWQLNPRVQFSCDVANLTNEPITRFRYEPSRISFISFGGTTITARISGRF